MIKLLLWRNRTQLLCKGCGAIIAGLLGPHGKGDPGTNPDFLSKIGLDSHLSATRKNGLSSMLTAIKTAAAK